MRAFSTEWALMNLQRAVALLGMKEGCLGMEDLGEVETAVVLLSQPTCRLEATCPSSVIISWGLEPVCSAFLRPIQALEELTGLEGLICTWRRPVVLRAVLSTVVSPSAACHLLSFLSVESSLLTENLLSLSSCLMQSHLKILFAGTPGDPRCSLEISWTSNHPLWIAASVTFSLSDSPNCLVRLAVEHQK